MAVRPLFYSVYMLSWCLCCSNASIKLFNKVQKVTPGMVIVLYLHFSLCTSFSKPETFPGKLARTLDGVFLKENYQQTTHKQSPPKTQTKNPSPKQKPANTHQNHMQHGEVVLLCYN